MKRFTLLMAAAAVLGFTACGDNTTGENPALATDIAGTYNGYSYSVSALQAYPWTAPAETVTITANGDNTASLTFASTGSWGTYTVDNVTFTKSGSGYKISGSGQVTLSMGGPGGSYSFTMTGAIDSGSNAEIVFVASVGGMGEITTTFVTGSMPDGLRVVGRYSGYTVADSSYFTDRTSDGATMTITINEDGTVNLTCSTAEFGTYSVENITVGNEGGVYTVEGGGTVSIGMGGAPADYDFTMEGGIVSADEAEVTFTVPAVMGGLTVKFITGTP